MRERLRALNGLSRHQMRRLERLLVKPRGRETTMLLRQPVVCVRDVPDLASEANCI
jgi:hypothetical protein